ncbi:MAG: hypothetical protein ACR2HN_12230 [Tepidiformaceae bacterium]
MLGGTFDPPDSGHLALAECARVQFALGRVLFVPAGDPWRKTGSGPGPEARGPGPPGGCANLGACHRPSYRPLRPRLTCLHCSPVSNEGRRS